MINHSSLAKVAGALIFAGISGGIFYILRQKWDEPWHTEKIEIPADLIGLLIGRKGANIKHIELKSNTKINFTDKDKDVPTRYCIIRGPEDCVRHAKFLVRTSLEEIRESNYTCQITVPSSIIGFVIGAKGRFIKDISSNTGVRIDVDKRTRNKSVRIITIRGPKEGAEVAVQLIKDKMDTVSRRDRKNEKKPSEVDTSGIAVVSPSLVYILPPKERKQRLNYLEDEMSDYYESLEGEDSRKAKFEIGDSVAALKSPNGKNWLRGLVVQIYSVNDEKAIQQNEDLNENVTENTETNGTLNLTENEKSNINNIDSESINDSVDVEENESDQTEENESNGVLNAPENGDIIDNVDTDSPIDVSAKCENGDSNDSNGILNSTEQEKSNISDDVDTEPINGNAKEEESKIKEKNTTGSTETSCEYVDASNVLDDTDLSSQEGGSVLYKVFLLDQGEFCVLSCNLMKALHIQFLEFPHQAQLAKIQGIEERDNCRSQGCEELVKLTKDANLSITRVGFSMVNQRLSGQALIDEESKIVNQLIESHSADTKEELHLARCEGMSSTPFSELIVKEEGIYSLKLQKSRPLLLIKIEKKYGTETLDVADYLLQRELVTSIPKKEDAAPDTVAKSQRAFHVDTITD